MGMRRSTRDGMKQSIRVIVAVLALVLLVAGTAFATHSPGKDHPGPVAASQEASPEAESDEPSPATAPKTEANADESDGAQLTEDRAQALVDLLDAQQIVATTDELKTLAAKYGVGGAMRMEAWAAATGKTVDELASLYDAAGVGWGAFAKQLEQADSSLSLSPGIGWIMGHGHGHANSNANHGKSAQHTGS